MRQDGSLRIFWGLTMDAETGGLGVYPAQAREILAERKRKASAGKKE